jgi:hypothetical protein
MGLPYVYPQRFNYESDNVKKATKYLYYSMEYGANSYYDVSGYDFLLKSTNYFSDNSANNVAIDLKSKVNETKINDQKIYKILATGKSKLGFFRNQEKLLEVDLTEKTNYIAKKYPYATYTAKKKDLTINDENDKLKVSIICTSMSLSKGTDGKISVQNIVSEILIKEKDNEK